MSKTIIISNRLPIKITEENGEYQLSRSEGGLATGLGSIYKNGHNIWIGWPGIEVPPERQENVRAQLEALNLFPVFLTQEEINLFYEGFSNEVLWPVFHYAVTYAKFEQAYWDCYRQVNGKFRDAVTQVAEENDRIWVHDYQLLLLPEMIRVERPACTIGFFQHIPFPSYEIFRLIPWRTELINGVLGADLIGFHTYDDVRHFMSTATRLLPVNSSANMVVKKDRQILVESFAMGIDFSLFESLPATDAVREHVAALKESIGNEQKIILSIDRLDYSKGIIQRLQAVELLLQEHPEYAGQFSLYMIVVPSRDTVPQYRELREQIDQLVGNINAHYRTLNWSPVHYYYRSFPMDFLSALYATADICLVTPMRDGMNLVSKEYVASRTSNTGVLILSEMAGASKELNDALIVNPNNIGDIMQAIVTGLTMPAEEQQARMQSMRDLVKKFNIHHWVRLFMQRLAEAKKMQQDLLTKYAGAAIRTNITGMYQRSGERCIFLDYDGTLMGFSGDIDKVSPDPELYSLLETLTSDPANRVVIISGRRHETLEQWFGHMKLDLIAEHGAWQKTGDHWHSLPLLTQQWKSEIRPVLETYTDRTPGSFIEEKSYSLVWHYRKADTGLGDLRAGEIVNHLKPLAADKGLQVMPGNKVIEFKNIEVNKGKSASNLIHDKTYDFILALGDDHTDEDIFKALPASALTIKVGSNISAARFYLNDFREVRRLLADLAEQSEKTDGVRLKAI
ncbi:bifunctional alpha,alpha-trehalose-phosphate synthase (UDP-forming)/trehalose-phosphatase [Pedobacter yulinensis]|uniref:Bifunctional alpha,alpha-trehalose-phosphate synthase (UDP-forming)/trehalose-phosphatase n=1 Tax=Pedobacter yulinensis TaxID=2126353 RepID=A0A2T3HHN4_9SPHI|nr:bifunctional alpha,alpha-trehalose-phosphate synthase (UDP-forming)/trehalose-phosphatase [Pedobacter yulinensis]PST81966.1 bifunctional alpha,alpha-trehalose-phosphate synthase (UDP-forming)/trehalose-phosphatase [Pedobacter yulinensis]